MPQTHQLAPRTPHPVLRQGVCLLVPHPEDARLLLTVTRPSRPDLIAMPGGKVEPQESRQEACVRELEEETGLKLQAQALRIVYTGLCRSTLDEDKFWVTTFTTSQPLPQAPGIQCERDIVPDWRTWQEICSPTSCPFAVYFQAVHDVWQRLMTQQPTPRRSTL